MEHGEKFEFRIEKFESYICILTSDVSPPLSSLSWIRTSSALLYAPCSMRPLQRTTDHRRRTRKLKKTGSHKQQSQGGVGKNSG